MSFTKIFAMMPFSSDFDDVYDVARQASNAVDAQLDMVRMDEIRSAGSITDDLLREIRVAHLCIADVTGANPNVMWECGFAAALHKPLIILCQAAGELPFDIHDVRAIRYDRNALSTTLRRPLQFAIGATIRRYLE